MSKWRPSLECLYVIPDIHGQIDQLELILSRILPLRKTDGVKDTIVFLGDYVDRGSKTPQVLDRMIELDKEYKGQVIMLMGNHELMLLDGIAPSKNSDNYLFWTKYGGIDTIASYLDIAGHHLEDPYALHRQRVKDFIPKEHIDFIKSRPFFYEKDNFIFVHGGCDPFLPVSGQRSISLAWDRSLFKIVKNIKGQPAWDKCIVTGHNCTTGNPFITSKFMMLDCSCKGKLLVLELNSMEGFVAKKGKKRLVKLEY